MSDEGVSQVPSVFSSKERAALVAKALSDAARRARFSTRRRRAIGGGGTRIRRGERLLRLLRIATFVVVVAVPSLGAALYFGLIASDQYVAEARFTVRGGLPPSMDSLGALTGAPSMLIVQDTQVIMNYLESRAIVEHLEKSVGLTSFYQGEDIDYFSRLGKHKPIEKVVKYWKRHVELALQMPAGIVVFTVKAFTPQDAVTIANAALDASDQLVNAMNDQMRDDAIGLAEKERARAQDNLAAARTDLQKARNDEGMLSAKDSSSALTQLITTTREQLGKMQQEYDSQRRFVSAGAPQLRNLQSKMDAAQKQIDKLQSEMTGTKVSVDGNMVLSGAMSRLDYALLQNNIEEKIYAGSLAALEHAKVASEMKLMYINTFVKPVAAEESKYPMRALDISLVVGASLVTWAAVLGIIGLARQSMS